MKYIKNILLSCTVVALTSCVNDDVNYTTTDKPTVSMTGQSATSIMEGETITVSLTTDATYKEEMDFKLELVSGGSNSDYIVSDADGLATGATSVDDGFGAFGYKIEFPAYAENHTFNITAVQDVLKEGTENLRFKLTSADNKNGLAAGGAIFIDLEVTNFVSDLPSIVVDWDIPVTYVTLEQNILETTLDDVEVSHTESLCGIADFDFYLNSFDAYAFTGDCPEVVDQNTVNSGSIGNGVLADGTYDLVVDLWDFDLGLDADVNEVLTGDFAFPFNVEISHIGTFNSGVINIPALYFSNSSTSAAAGGSGETVVATIEVVGGKYKVYDMLGELVAAE
ncbi:MULTISPECIES: hypothetical protein [unclassified Olleya]|jgi:hypothetical protein|uniref:hypothetical protein n=1 Tax=unclassified Olleya TaxID=2615019 RepID=UPI00119F4553|nr:hypothetical protein [Olleya sp. Hel_I_94]TVZ50074.1 hypothetical protein JM82_0521 [Olleya sp. Hel_I_94]